MLSRLITSKTRVKVLTLFLTHPDERFYFKNLIDRLHVPPTILHSELRRFEEIGLLESQREANIKFYRVNKNFPLYPELKSIVFKTVGLADYLKEALSKIGHIESAFIYGSVAKNVEDVRSDIDLTVIGDVDMDELHDAVDKAEEAISREISFTVFDPKEWQERIKKKESFVMDVLRNPKIFLIGDENALRKLAETKSN
jgi:predicted nucleotidyltransferase